MSADDLDSGVTETVLTYEAYLANAAKTFISKGANVIISSGQYHPFAKRTAQN